MSIYIERRDDSFVAAENGTCLIGRYESPAAAEIAIATHPSRLQYLWSRSLAEGRDGLILESELRLYDYYLRFIESDRAQVEALAELLGVGSKGDDGIFYGEGWAWCGNNGALTEPTGECFVDPVMGMHVEVRRAITDNQGNPYIHVNLRLNFDLGDRARALAVSHPDMLVALQNLGRYFLLDANGKPRAPKNPQQVFS